MTAETNIEIQNVVFACPGNSKESYDRGGRALATFYADLLGMRIAREDWFVLEDADDLDGLNLAFGDGPIDYRPPRWPDSESPQQMHLDISVRDLDDAEQRTLKLGASKLQDNASFRVYADPDGHPFCLYGTATQAAPRIERVVLDCFSPRSLADFYASLLDMPNRELDTPERVVIARSDGRLPALAFQHAQFPAPRWPDPAHPQQVHLDLRVVEPNAPRMHAARELAEQLGAIRLPDEGLGHRVYADPAGHPFCL
ncbi:VOC family protein [Actinopolymorpha sp. B17G11]|uniref:VOC family protein n=1 Tax=Actinopolymorpha sp. B17G11 TaxID=3160861 RepID=UPI0032E47F39